MGAPEALVRTTSLLAAGFPKWDPSHLWAPLALVGLLLFGALVIWLVDRWRKRWTQESTPHSGDQITQYRKLYEAGDLTAEEFAKIRNKLTEAFMKTLEKPTPPPPETPVSETPKSNGPKT